MLVGIAAFRRTLLFLCLCTAAPAQDPPVLPAAERVVLAEAFAVAERLAPQMWSEWRAVPFAVLLVTDEHEFLLRHPRPPKDFVVSETDPLLNHSVLVRRRVFPPNLLATFPLEGVPTVVIGTMAATGKRSASWLMTLLHEHLHQLQYSRPGYYEGVNALNLARGDQTGMWMLNYAFPYDSPELNQAFADMRDQLLAALKEPAAERLSKYAAARRRFHAMLSPDDRKYMEFQLWQEGVARYLELEMARRAAAEHKVGERFRALPEADELALVAQRLRQSTLDELSAARLAEGKRVVFYPLGAAEVMLLDAQGIDWRASYLEQRFTLAPYFTR